MCAILRVSWGLGGLIAPKTAARGGVDMSNSGGESDEK
jgi:hypothetical protein